MKALAYVLAAGMAAVLLAFVGLVVAGKVRAAWAGGAKSWAVVDREGRPVGGRFDEAGAFSAGLVAVAVDGRWGYADRDGTLVIAPRFTRAWPFDGDHAVAEDGVDVGIVDRTGAWVVKPAYRRIDAISDGVAVVFGAVGTRSSRISAGQAELSAGLVRVDETVIVAPAKVGDPARWLSARGPSEGRLAVEREDGWHLADLDGRVIELGFEELYEPHEGLAAASRGGAWGYVDGDGRFVIEPRWRAAGPFAEGRAPVEDADGWRIVDARGAVVGDGVYGDLRPFREGLAAAMSADGLWGFVDRDGAWAIAPTWKRVGDEGFTGGRARVARPAGLDYEWAWIDAEGRVACGWYAGIGPFDGERATARLPG